jgi:hypothetical protein
MPKILCNCNTIIPLGEIPSSHQFLIISDVNFDNFQDQVNAEDVYAAMEIVAKCPNCARLHIFWDGYKSPQTVYKIED